jgi:hypothetical protein
LRPDSSRNKAFDELDSRAGIKKEKKPTVTPPKDDTKIPPTTDKGPKTTDSDPNAEFEDIGDGESLPSDKANSELETEQPPDAKSVSDRSKPEAGKKPNPWRLADEWKKKAQEAEKRIEEIKSASPVDHPEYKTLKETLAQKEKREKELVDELRYYNFEKHDEGFKTQFDAPYRAAWVAAVEEISQFPVMLEGDATRPANADDLLKLVNLPPVEARELAEQMFGKYADDVLMERKRVREKFDARARALNDAKKGLGETQAAKEKQKATAEKELADNITKLWESSKKFTVEHPQYGEFFKPIEGDQDGNQRLAKGFELVERAMNEDPNDPSLTPQQRAEIIRRHSFVYHRAAAFGRSVMKIKSLTAKVAEMEKELAQYRNTEPGEGEGLRQRGAPAAPANGLDGAFAELDRRAKGQR